jgi:T-complex protein 1 subunit eta
MAPLVWLSDPVSTVYLQDSLLIRGVAFKKTFSYAGFEQQPKSFVNPKVLCLNVELELKAEKDNAEVRVNEVSVSRFS